uniref:hypothetical protein n=1 Tax=uncultured Winogradskyella sp. TaxID=395353 RepID=UPI0026279D6B
MKKIGFILFLVFVLYPVYGQNEASNWYFGWNAGVTFDATEGTVTSITDGQLRTLEGCTSISDADGNLLFYSDGRTIWSGLNTINGIHQVMQNGTGLRGAESSTSSGVIVPKPQDPSTYYLFTVDEPHHIPSSREGGNFGLNYSQINLNDNNGFGAVDINLKNVQLQTFDQSDPLQVEYKCSEKITAVSSDDCSSIWVITHFVNRFYAFKIDENGVDPNPRISDNIFPEVPVTGYRRNALGYMKASPDGTKLLVAHYGFAENNFGGNTPGGVYLYDFNPSSGFVSGGLELYSPSEGNSPYGVEFSAENRKAYATVGSGATGNGASWVFQWDLEAMDIPDSRDEIYFSNTISAGALQLGIDRKIYRAQYEFEQNTGAFRYLGVIENPEADGEDIIYDDRGVELDINGSQQNTSRIGLPPFIQSLFNSETDIIRNGISTTELRLCTGDSYTLQAGDIPGADYVWSFDGNSIAGNNQAELFIDTPGFYQVFIEPNNGECPIEGSAIVGVFEIPVANEPTDISVCDTAANDGIFDMFDFSNKNGEALLAQEPDQHNVRYFETEEDAENLENEISFPFTNAVNPQTIYVRVDNVENTNCFDINSFEIEVFNTPQIVQLNTLEFCDDDGDPTDGFATIALGDLIPTIRGEQSETETNITFHGSQEDADNNDNQLALSYTNDTAFNDSVFVRIENTTNTTCFSTGSFEIIINAAPAANNITIVQCDEDGIQEGFTIFNISPFTEAIIESTVDRSISFHISQNDAQNDENPIDPDAFENFFNPQIIYTRVTNTNTGCVSFSEVSLEVSTTASNDASIFVCDDDGNEDGFAAFNLNNTNAIVLAGAPAGLPVTYYETYNDALLENNPLGSSYTNTVAYNQTIYARVENNNACYGISEIELTVFELPNIETAFETIYCINFSPEPIILDAGVINASTSDFFYQWSTGETTAFIEIDTPGTYTVRVSNTDGCFKDRTINVLPSNVATITNVDIVDASENNTVSIIVSGEGDYEYALVDSNGPYQDSNTFTDVEPGLYTVYVRDKNNCGISEELISVIGFPKFFTPN